MWSSLKPNSFLTPILGPALLIKTFFAAPLPTNPEQHFCGKKQHDRVPRARGYHLEYDGEVPEDEQQLRRRLEGQTNSRVPDSCAVRGVIRPSSNSKFRTRQRRQLRALWVGAGRAEPPHHPRPGWLWRKSRNLQKSFNIPFACNESRNPGIGNTMFGSGGNWLHCCSFEG